MSILGARGLRGFAAAAVVLLASAATASTTTLISRGAVWKYLDNGTNQGTAWRATAFDDSAWASGPAELGYGDGDENTTVSFGPSSSNKYITTYFRHAFTVPDPTAVASLAMSIKRDDGAVVYLNGTEVYRSNMPTGTVNHTTLASGAALEGVFLTDAIDTANITTGTNVLAVEIHQATAGSSDISFDLDLICESENNLTRGPYLQMATPESIRVRWRTNATTESVVRYGLTTSSLTNSATSGTATEHEVAITGLTPGTRYYYSIGSQATALAGPDDSMFFDTHPTTGTHKQTRVWVLGDSGTANANAAAVRNGYTSFTGTRHTDLWLMLGDNAYNTGTDSEFQAAVFDMYPAMLRKSVLWPTFGNHDAGSAVSSSQSGVYYDIFSLPRSAEAGGLPTGTEAYYSFDYGRIHFVCLDSQGTDRTSGSAMLTWLSNDLAATPQDWIVAYFHHPPYTKGSHNSDSVADSGGRMTDMRQNALPILEAAGVDLVLTGHSHSYERSYLLNGHYGLSTSITPAMILDGGSGRIGGDGAYEKSVLNTGSNDGAVYAVAGSSGQISGGSLNHPAMYISMNTLGSMVLDIDKNQMDAYFLGTAGNTLDYFSIVKDTATTPGVAAITRLDPDPTTASVVRYRVEFSQAVTGVDASDFTLVPTGSAAGTVSAISGSGSIYEVTVSVSTGFGTLRLDLADDDTVSNGIAAPLGGPGAANGNFTAGETYTFPGAVPVALSQFDIH